MLSVLKLNRVLSASAEVMLEGLQLPSQSGRELMALPENVPLQL